MNAGEKKSDNILNELKRRRTEEKIVDVEEATVKIVIFTLLGDYYAFYGEDIKEILHLSNIFYVPGSPDFIPGIINIRGDIESVININGFLGLPDSVRTDKSRIVVASRGGMKSGILVDSVEDVSDMPVSSIKPALLTLGAEVGDLVAGELICMDKNTTLLDVGKIFAKIAS